MLIVWPKMIRKLWKLDSLSINGCHIVPRWFLPTNWWVGVKAHAIWQCIIVVIHWSSHLTRYFLIDGVSSFGLAPRSSYNPRNQRASKILLSYWSIKFHQRSSKIVPLYSPPNQTSELLPYVTLGLVVGPFLSSFYKICFHAHFENLTLFLSHISFWGFPSNSS